MAHLVTGDAVVLELRLARLASRALALFLDMLAQLVLAIAVFRGLTLLLPEVDDALAAAIGLVLVVLLVVGYPVIWETATRGRTLGKLALGLRVVRDDGGPIRFRHALMRGLVAFLEIWALTGGPALITSLLSQRGKRLGDLLAGTVVVRERMPAQGGPVAMMPYGLAGWASGLELGRLPDDLALAARQYLSRASELAPGARDDMGARLASAVAAVVTPPPPPGVPPYAYLAAVLAERRRRELARMQPAAGPYAGQGPQPPGPYGPPSRYQPVPYGQPIPHGAQPAPYGPPTPHAPWGAPAPARPDGPPTTAPTTAPRGTAPDRRDADASGSFAPPS
jgi:uncharacterized RDD family membrane protein YckC